MAITDEELAFALELFAPLGGISKRKMMGGASIYCDGQIFAILSADGRVFIKAKDALAAEMAAEGAEKFTMEDGRGMHYWTLPDSALDDPDAACIWGRKALDAL